MSQPFMPKPTPEGLKRYPPDGRYPAPEGFFDEPASDPCTCEPHCENPCVGESDCECLACSLRSVVENDAGQTYPKDPA
jgi:hypothetical protein